MYINKLYVLLHVKSYSAICTIKQNMYLHLYPINIIDGKFANSCMFHINIMFLKRYQFNIINCQ